MRVLPTLFLFLFLPLWCGNAWQPFNEATKTTRQGKDLALFIVVEDYEEWSDLRYPVKDAGRIATELENQYGYTTETLTNPTRRQILDKLAAYRDKTFASDGQLLVFFSGHGEFASETSEGFFVPKDGLKEDQYQDSYVALSRLKRAVNAIPCDHILLAIDACYSGAIDDRIAVKSDNDPPTFGRPGSNNLISQAGIDQIVKDRLRTKTRLYFTSGGLEQTPDRSQFVDQFMAALGSTSRQEPILGYNGLRYFLGKASPIPRTGIFDGNKAGTNDFLFIRSFTSEGSRIDTENARTDLADWRTAQSQNNCAAYRTYLQKHPYGDFASAARTKTAPCDAEDSMIAAWAAAKRTNDCDSYAGFASNYPDSPYITAATKKREELNCGDSAPPDNMVFITGGTFQMGDQFGDGDEDELPVHAVTLSDYYLSRTELMVGQFADFIEATGYTTTAEVEGSSVAYTDSWGRKKGVTWRDNKAGESRPSTEYNHPVSHVSWYDAVAYCNWWSEQSGYTPVYTIAGDQVTANWSADGYRLPTEAEWEYAARSGGKKEKWAGTSTASELIQFSNYSIANISYHQTAPVGKLRANNLGLADMSGNVYEWCWDWYSDDFYSKSRSQIPNGPDKGSSRVVRGGSWSIYSSDCRTANRSSFSPRDRNNYVGFRLARNAR